MRKIAVLLGLLASLGSFAHASAHEMNMSQETAQVPTWVVLCFSIFLLYICAQVYKNRRAAGFAALLVGLIAIFAHTTHISGPIYAQTELNLHKHTANTGNHDHESHSSHACCVSPVAITSSFVTLEQKFFNYQFPSAAPSIHGTSAPHNLANKSPPRA